MTTSATFQADATAAIKVASDGTKYLDTAALRTAVINRIHATIDAFSYGYDTTSEPSVKTHAKKLSYDWVDQTISALNNVVKKEHWASRPDWPQTSTVASDAVNTKAPDDILDALSALNAACDAVGAHYQAKLTYYSDYIRTKIYDEMISWLVPDPVTRVIESRYYIYTYVNDWGEESAPSPVSRLVELDQNDTATVTVTSPPSGRNVVGFRIYRSSTSNTGAAFQYVSESTFPTLSIVDDKPQEQLLEACSSFTWIEPPADLSNLTGMPNGILAGTTGKVGVVFSEPFKPYAWPAAYELTLEYKPVAMACFGQTLFIGTQGSPYIITGADSASMSAQKLESNQACISKRSMIAVEGGVVYASPDGICFASLSGVEVLTHGIVDSDTWASIDPANRFATIKENVYFLFHETQPTYYFDLRSRRLGSISLSPTAAYTDKLDDILYVVSGTNVVPMFTGANTRTATWRSAVIHLEQPSGFAWLHLVGQHSETTPATVRVYNENTQLLHTAVITNNEPVRFPPGRFREWKIEIQSAARISFVVLASDTFALNEA